MSDTAQPLTSVADFPGVSDVVDFGTGTDALDIGYRWYQAHDVQPLFPFGFGLSYTKFSLDNPSIQETGSNVVVRVDVAQNVGTHDGTDVVQSYVSIPRRPVNPPNN